MRCWNRCTIRKAGHNMRAFRHEDDFSLPLPTVEHTRPRFDLQNICIHALCHCGGNSPLKVAHTQARAGARFLEITSLYCLISSRGSRHVPCIFSGAGTRPLSASSCSQPSSATIKVRSLSPGKAEPPATSFPLTALPCIMF